MISAEVKKLSSSPLFTIPCKLAQSAKVFVKRKFTLSLFFSKAIKTFENLFFLFFKSIPISWSKSKNILITSIS